MRRTIAAVVALLYLLAFAPVAWAGTQGSCPPDDTMKVRFYENSIGDGSDNNDTWWRCSSSDSSFGNDTHTLTGLCKAFVKPTDTWDDCISSVQAYYPSGYRFCLYGNENYVGAGEGNAGISGSGNSGVRFNTGAIGVGSDQATSYRFQPASDPTC
jgi:hypothetical protein